MGELETSIFDLISQAEPEKKLFGLVNSGVELTQVWSRVAALYINCMSVSQSVRI